jgi:hypothetical protein
MRADRPSTAIAAPRRGPAWRLRRALLHLAGPGTRLLKHSERPWASATFEGTRHVVALRFAGLAGMARAEAFIAALPEHEFTVPGHFVAKATVTHVEQRFIPSLSMTVETDILLLEDC